MKRKKIKKIREIHHARGLEDLTFLRCKFSHKWSIDLTRSQSKCLGTYFLENAILIVKFIYKCKDSIITTITFKKTQLEDSHYLISRLLTKLHGINIKIDPEITESPKQTLSIQSIDCWQRCQNNSMAERKVF